MFKSWIKILVLSLRRHSLIFHFFLTQTLTLPLNHIVKSCKIMKNSEYFAVRQSFTKKVIVFLPENLCSVNSNFRGNSVYYTRFVLIKSNYFKLILYVILNIINIFWKGTILYCVEIINPKLRKILTTKKRNGVVLQKMNGHWMKSDEQSLQ